KLLPGAFQLCETTMTVKSYWPWKPLPLTSAGVLDPRFDANAVQQSPIRVQCPAGGLEHPLVGCAFRQARHDRIAFAFAVMDVRFGVHREVCQCPGARHSVVLAQSRDLLRSNLRLL